MNKYLLTFDCVKDFKGNDTFVKSYEWFESEEKMVEFVKTLGNGTLKQLNVLESIEIIDSRSVDL